MRMKEYKENLLAITYRNVDRKIIYPISNTYTNYY